MGRFRQLETDQHIAQDKNRRHCPQPDCQGVIKKPRREHFDFLGGSFLLALLCASIGIAVGTAGKFAWNYPIHLCVLPCAVGALLGLALAMTRPGPRRIYSKWGISAAC